MVKCVQALGLPISYSAKELAHFERIRKQFEQQDVPNKAKEAMPTDGPPKPTTWSSLPMRRQDASKLRSTPSSGLADNSGNSITGKDKGKGRAIANPDSGPEDSGDGDDHYTKRPAGNGTVNQGRERRKTPFVDGLVDTEDEDLYS